MKKFVDFNAEKRAGSTNDFYRNIYKLMNNANYGRLLMNKRNHRDVRIVTKDSLLQKLIRNPQFSEHVIVAPNVVLVYMQRKSVLLNAPIYAGMCVLDIAKTHMNRFYYDVLCTHIDKLRLCYTDTDSLLIRLTSDRDIFDLLRPIASTHLDLSVYPDAHPLKDDTNKGRIGCFKDEARDGKQIQEFVGLRAKMYVYRYGSDEKEVKFTSMKAKGIKSSYVKHNLTFEDYKRTLFDGTEPEKAEFNQIQSRLFRITTKTVVKRSLSAADDKRVINNDRINTMPYGHYKLRTIAEEPTAEEDSNENNDNDII
ncbi:uncharacterized protein LOC129000276 [Macrosteles quadrilineatus]|uniref:uncharacterized protein LOC129000276 n=1 Tax=Macrosteles quadrilineatus TaxID=74068 RepID=UPI0023E2BD82|nr:uncharacterized protein LOC129000276 [Macrosteles quadrilineatus]